MSLLPDHGSDKMQEILDRLEEVEEKLKEFKKLKKQYKELKKRVHDLEYPEVKITWPKDTWMPNTIYNGDLIGDPGILTTSNTGVAWLDGDNNLKYI